MTEAPPPFKIKRILKIDIEESKACVIGDKASAKSIVSLSKLRHDSSLLLYLGRVFGGLCKIPSFDLEQIPSVDLAIVLQPPPLNQAGRFHSGLKKHLGCICMTA